MNDSRWTEIKFINLVTQLYNNLKDYTATINYITSLAQIAGIDSLTALRLIQKINQTPGLSPSRIEFITIAKQHEVATNVIIKVLHISKRDYMIYLHEIDPSTKIPPKCSKQEVFIMQELLKAHNKLKEASPL